MKRRAGRGGFGQENTIPIWKGPAAIVMVMVPEVYNRPYQGVTPSETEPLRQGVQLAGECRKAGIYGDSGVWGVSGVRSTKREYAGLEDWLLGRDLNPQPSG